MVALAAPFVQHCKKFFVRPVWDLKWSSIGTLRLVSCLCFGTAGRKSPSLGRLTVPNIVERNTTYDQWYVPQSRTLQDLASCRPGDAPRHYPCDAVCPPKCLFQMERKLALLTGSGQQTAGAATLWKAKFNFLKCGDSSTIAIAQLRSYVRLVVNFIHAVSLKLTKCLIRGFSHPIIWTVLKGRMEDSSLSPAPPYPNQACSYGCKWSIVIWWRCHLHTSLCWIVNSRWDPRIYFPAEGNRNPWRCSWYRFGFSPGYSYFSRIAACLLTICHFDPVSVTYKVCHRPMPNTLKHWMVNNSCHQISQT